jgi:hypothetical protein
VSVILGYAHNGYVTVLEGWIQYGGCNVVSNRNRIVEDFLAKSKAEHLLFVDTDESFLPDAPRVLQEAALDTKGVVGGAYPLVDGSNVFYSRSGPGEYRSVPPTAGLIQEVDALGTGLMMIPRHILVHMKDEIRLPSAWWFGQDYEGERLLGSDLTFCARVRACGHRLYGHGDVRAGHLKPQLLELS